MKRSNPSRDFGLSAKAEQMSIFSTTRACYDPH